MKTAQIFTLTATLLGVSTLGVASVKKAETYAVTGFFKRQKPAPELVEKAAAELGRKMNGMVQVAEPENADHRVEILFDQGKYKIYVDALPLATGYKDMRMREEYQVFRGDAMERAESARSEAARAGK